MFRSLFARLTGAPKRGEALFGLAVAQARQPHWFIDGRVPDTVNGRFAVLATVTALIIVRLEQAGNEGEEASVALTERFVETLDAEVREMGVSDPGIGKQVRKLVGALASRVGRWRKVTLSRDGWPAEIRHGLYLEEPTGDDALAHSESALKELWSRLCASGLDDLLKGQLQ